jgi:hypothetical protein
MGNASRPAVRFLRRRAKLSRRHLATMIARPMRAWPSSASAATAVSQSRTGWLSCRRSRAVPNGCSARCRRSWLTATASRSPTARSRAPDRRRHRHRAPPASARTQTKDADDRSHCVFAGLGPRTLAFTLCPASGWHPPGARNQRDPRARTCRGSRLLIGHPGICLDRRRERASTACPCRRACQRPAPPGGGEVPQAATGRSPN